MRTSCVKNSLVVGVILLFIGVAVAPSINANLIKEENFVEYTTEVIGFSRGKRTVKLTHEESQEVELLLDSIQEQLESAKSMEKAKEIYKKGVIELDKYGLLAGLSIEDAQKLVTRDLTLNNRQRILDIGLNLTQNIFCLFSGTVHVTDPGPYAIVFCFPFSFLGLLGFVLGMSIGYIGLERIGLAIAILFIGLSTLNPLKFMNLILSVDCGWEIISFGLKGLVESDNAGLILGYTGLMIYSKGNYGSYYFNFLGYCLGFT